MLLTGGWFAFGAAFVVNSVEHRGGYCILLCIVFLGLWVRCVCVCDVASVLIWLAAVGSYMSFHVLVPGCLAVYDLFWLGGSAVCGVWVALDFHGFAWSLLFYFIWCEFGGCVPVLLVVVVLYVLIGGWWV